MTRSSLSVAGLSGAELEGRTVETVAGRRHALVLKRIHLASDWTARRTGDTVGREAAIATDPALAGVWEVYRSPYRAVSRRPGEVCLLMDDLSADLVPAGTGLSATQLDRFLTALARLHARFWQADALRSVPWLAPPAVRFSILGPNAATEEAGNPLPLFAQVRQGWELALGDAPPDVRRLLLLPAETLVARFRHLPVTLLHGDAKIANVAFLADGGITAFDWATTGWGPAILDLAYLLAVNLPLLPAGAEDVVTGYRDQLEEALGHALPGAQWDELMAVGLLGGARMLLWARALAAHGGSAPAREEYRWWLDRLTALGSAGWLYD